MRVLVCSDRIGAAAPPDAGAALARAFVRAGSGTTQAAVVPLASGGSDLSLALDALGSAGRLIGGSDAGSMGRALLGSLVGSDGPVCVDLCDLADAGPEAATRLVDVLGGPGAVRSFTPVDLVGVLPPGQEAMLLLGPQGLASRHGYALGQDLADVLAANSALEALAAALGVPDGPGLGAAGGTALVLAALGARLDTGVGLCRSASRLDATLAFADLVVVGTDAVTTGNFGGPALMALAELASARGVPCLALAREVSVSGGELRQHGVEAAHALGGEPLVDAAELTERAGRVAASWTW